MASLILTLLIFVLGQTFESKPFENKGLLPFIDSETYERYDSESDFTNNYDYENSLLENEQYEKWCALM